MKGIIKKWKVLFLTLSLFLMCSSATAFATEIENGALDITTPGDTLVDIYESGDYIIEFKNPNQAYTYTGKEIRPEFDVFLVETDESGIEKRTELAEDCYTVKYEKNLNAGTAKISVTGVEEKGYRGTINAEFVIGPKSLEKAKVTLSTTKYTYSGSDRKPGVTVVLDGATLKNGRDYKVTYSNCREVGTATVAVAGINNYAGSKKSTYSIIVDKTSVSTKPYYNKVKISWGKIAGATGYEVYRSTSKNGTYKNIAKVKAGTTSYKNENLTTGKTYYYKVRAYRTVNGKPVYGEYSSAKKQRVQPVKATITEIKRESYSSLKITWKKVSGASGYAVYRSTSKGGEYKKVATIKKGSTLSYTNKDLKCGKTYYYKVKAYRKVDGKNYYGSASDIVSQNTKPSKVKFDKNSITYTGTTISLKWKKASGAKGYKIYRATSKNGTYKKVKTITSNSKLSWKDTGLTKNKVYYYKIRSYCKVGDKTVYGSYSDVYKKAVAGWRYSTYDGKKVKLYYNSKGKLVKDVSNIIGKQSSYVIKVNKKKCTVTVYAKDGKNGYIIPVKAFICSPGHATPIGTFYTPQKYRWHELMGPCWGQWCTRINGGVLFHSVFYNSYNNNNALSVGAYNKLGTICSHGCVRLTAGDAKWIYDNCKLKTKVIIYNSSKEGPLGKPKASKLKWGHTWDPTDPNMKKKCKARGCH